LGFVISVVLFIGGYTLLDWGHYVAQGKAVSMMYLLTGKTQQEKTVASGGSALPGNPAASVGGGDTNTGGGGAWGAISSSLGSSTPPVTLPSGQLANGGGSGLFSP
jgi:hypothetical protein